MSDPFARLAKSVLTRLGRDALLRSTETCKVPLDRGVEMIGQHGEVVGLRTVATIDKALAPEPGDELEFVGTSESYTLDAPIEDDGYTMKFTLLEA